MGKELLQDVIDKYLKRGFGSMNKNDFEVFIFSKLLDGSLDKSLDYSLKSNYEISLALKIPESKVKRLSYEAKLKYSNNIENDCQSAFLESIKKIKLQKERKNDNVNISFVVESISVRKYIEYKLKENGKFADFHFKSEVISINIDDFTELVEVCAGSHFKNDITKKIRNDNLPQIKDVVKDLIMETFNISDNNITDYTIFHIENIIDKVKEKLKNL